MATQGAAPARLGRYELLARLAAGGMGEIFLARLEGAAGFEKLFVIKRILPHLADDERFRQMLVSEARVASMMTHPNICHVYELGQTDEAQGAGQLYIAMEYLEGVTLLSLLRRVSRERRALDLGLVAGVIQQATDALHYAHELRDRAGEMLGIVHRDVTPGNLFLTDAGVVKILDFGIAKVKDVSAHTQTGMVKGKYAYMAPEQLRGGALDRRADVFGLGVVLYEVLALRRLFQRKTDYLTFRAVMEQPITDIRRYRPDCPERLARVVAHALERDPEARFETVRQFGSAVLDALGGIARPWTQGEIGDFVRASFADELAQRSAQIAGAVRAGPLRHTVPLIAISSDETTDPEGDAQDFPEIDSEISQTPVDIRHLQRPSVEHTAVDERLAVGHQSGPNIAPNFAPNFGPRRDPTDPRHDPSPDPSLDALRGVPGTAPPPSPAPVMVMSPRRSIVWPLIAFAMLAVAGCALFLVWRQMQNQAPTPLVITSESGSRVMGSGSNVIIVGANPPGAPDDPPIGSATGSAGSATGSAGAPDPKPNLDRLRGVYRNAVRAQQAGMMRCATEHGNPPAGTKLEILIGADGRARRVSLDPANVDAGSFGTCIKDLLKGVAFPTGGEFDLKINLQ